ncbi:hypothetical protein IT397_02190 [Candidatus Nomurabacteria bacterium]|nr:hypothetical protein [Candidatus Nomurabacteria bacterium]
MKILEKLFGSDLRVKVLRLFLFNLNQPFDKEDVILRAKIKKSASDKEIKMLLKIGLIKRKVFYKEFIKGKDRVKRRVRGFVLNESFPHLSALQGLLIHTMPLSSGDIITRLGRAGKIKLVIVSGVFIQDWDSRVDMLIVGDSIKRSKLNEVVKIMESEIGKELRYAVFDTGDFNYRMSMYDKLIRDVLDYPHKILIDKIGIV